MGRSITGILPVAVAVRKKEERPSPSIITGILPVTVTASRGYNGERVGLSRDPVRVAWRFVFLLGLVSLCADLTYEGARSITGPYLGVLGATGAVVGFASGFGELVGYGFRVISGYVADRTRRYWLLTISGYAVNLLAVPLLALAQHWELAAGLIIVERLGKAVRTPARDVMLSYATRRVGRGWGFGFHEAMDQIGALLGPIIVLGILFEGERYRLAFLSLGVPAIAALVLLLLAWRLYPNPREMEPEGLSASPAEEPLRYRSREIGSYLVGVALIAAGFADFPLVAFHIHRQSIASPFLIPLFYAIAMWVDAVAALIFGRLYDRIGMVVLAVGALISSFFAPLVFSEHLALVLAGVVLWGVGMGAQESVMRAAVADLVPPDSRGFAYGIFNAAYGAAWFAGSLIIGTLYDRSRALTILFCVVLQLAAVPVFLRLRARLQRSRVQRPA